MSLRNDGEIQVQVKESFVGSRWLIHVTGGTEMWKWEWPRAIRVGRRLTLRVAATHSPEQEVNIMPTPRRTTSLLFRKLVENNSNSKGKRSSSRWLVVCSFHTVPACLLKAILQPRIPVAAVEGRTRCFCSRDNRVNHSCWRDSCIL